MSTTAGIIWKTVVGTVVSVNIGVLAWTVQTVVEEKKDVAVIQAQRETDHSMLTDIQQNGTTKFQAHQREDDDRVKTIRDDIRDLKTSMLSMQSVVSDMGAVKEQLKMLSKGQDRIEFLLKKPL